MTQPWPLAERPNATSAAERQLVADAAMRNDVQTVREALAHNDDRVRVSAVRGLLRLGELDKAAVAIAANDSSYRVRRATAEAGATATAVDLGALLVDAEPLVIETACWAAGERGSSAVSLVHQLATISTDHDDALCRESAVAALGAIGAHEGLPAILAATSDRATVRRRAILALAPFDSPQVTAALERALEDRDWQVRQAAEDLI